MTRVKIFLEEGIEFLLLSDRQGVDLTTLRGVGFWNEFNGMIPGFGLW